MRLWTILGSAPGAGRLVARQPTRVMRSTASRAVATFTVRQLDVSGCGCWRSVGGGYAGLEPTEGEPEMASDSLQDQLVKYLTDAHSIEEQALQQMRAAPDIAADDRLAQAFRQHLTETE